VVDALRQMLVGKAVHAFQFDDELNHRTGHTFAVSGPLIDLLQESGAQHIGKRTQLRLQSGAVSYSCEFV
jgi:hypothetical protein